MKRLRLKTIASHLKALPAFAAVHVGTGYDRDYHTSFGKVYPAVWVGAQRQTRQGDRAGSREIHQRANAQVVVRLVVQRYANGDIDPETGLDTLHNAVIAGMAGYKPPEAWSTFRFESAQDGPPDESVLTEDIVFEAQTLYRETP